ncbi:uncharacterized protein LOC131224879 [Magnolia sinica]|uniref:uncharacterized protein LOC131224879 n=1 Tax=Magnolia sinica TaxID=86752 RepID=UPI00265AC1EC|nr:uncharacterized protein LOC131224879 [Magnolia sinica]
MAKGKKKTLPVASTELEPNGQQPSSSRQHAESAPTGLSQRSRSRGDLVSQKAMMCRAFSITLTRAARNWYRQLKLRSISNFAKLSRLFLTQFIGGKKSRKPLTHLLTLKQGSRESLKVFISHFNEEALQVDDYDDKMALSVMISGLKEGKFFFSIRKNPPTTLAKLINRSQKYTTAKEFFSSRKNVQAIEHSSKGKRPRDDELQSPNKRSDDRTSQDRRPSREPENCVDLKEEIETLIRKGHLRQYLKEEKPAQKDDQPSRPVEEAAKIQTIYGGPSGGGDSNRARKAYLRSSDPEHYVHLTKRPRKEHRVSPCSLTFTEDDARGI